MVTICVLGRLFSHRASLQSAYIFRKGLTLVEKATLCDRSVSARVIALSLFDSAPVIRPATGLQPTTTTSNGAASTMAIVHSLGSNF